jgi:hypothetical protein
MSTQAPSAPRRLVCACSPNPPTEAGGSRYFAGTRLLILPWPNGLSVQRIALGVITEKNTRITARRFAKHPAQSCAQFRAGWNRPGPALPMNHTQPTAVGSQPMKARLLHCPLLPTPSLLSAPRVCHTQEHSLCLRCSGVPPTAPSLRPASSESRCPDPCGRNRVGRARVQGSASELADTSDHTIAVAMRQSATVPSL